MRNALARRNHIGWRRPNIFSKPTVAELHPVTGFITPVNLLDALATGLPQFCRGTLNCVVLGPYLVALSDGYINTYQV